MPVDEVERHARGAGRSLDGVLQRHELGGKDVLNRLGADPRAVLVVESRLQLPGDKHAERSCERQIARNTDDTQRTADDARVGHRLEPSFLRGRLVWRKVLSLELLVHPEIVVPAECHLHQPAAELWNDRQRDPAIRDLYAFPPVVVLVLDLTRAW